MPGTFKFLSFVVHHSKIAGTVNLPDIVMIEESKRSRPTTINLVQFAMLHDIGEEAGSV
jgi:hypothetical protein